MTISIRQATHSDIEKIKGIEEAMYGVSYTIETFTKCLQVFPQGFMVAEKQLGDNEKLIVGFVATERLCSAKAIPYAHDPQKFHDSSGKVLYLSGFGVVLPYQKEDVGLLLYKALIDLSESLGIEIFEVLCNEKDPEDQYEMSILRRLNFSKGEVYDWEVFPGKIKPHMAWILRIRSRAGQ